jgi:hypothetical protein
MSYNESHLSQGRIGTYNRIVYYYWVKHNVQQGPPMPDQNSFHV